MSGPDPAASARVLAFVSARRAEIAPALSAFLARKGPELAKVSPLGPEACARLDEFASRGKMVRGALVGWAASLGSCAPLVPVAAAVAMELFQAALLVHDDIMDRDTERRGLPTLHRRYAEEAKGIGLADPDHLGDSLGICVGDIAFFLAFEVLAELDLEGAAKSRLVSLFARELSLVGVAQMMDMTAAGAASAQSTEEILRLYLYKTGRYTFSLPLAAGAVIGGLADERRDELERIGELLGMLFQIKDDEIGLFGDPADTGKPVGSDVREGKKTIFHAFLMRLADGEERERIRSLWGAPALSEPDLRSVIDVVRRSGVRDEVDALIRSLAARAVGIARSGGHPFLEDLVAWSLERRR